MLKFSEYSKLPVVKQLNENVVQKGNILTVTFTYDMSMDVVEEYRKKVKSEDDKNLLVQFSGAVIAEKMIKYALDNFLTVDNIPSNAFIDSAKDEVATPEVTQTDTAAEEPAETPAKEGGSEGEVIAEEPVAETEIPQPDEAAAKKEEEEEESNYLNLYTTMGNPVSTGFKLQSPTHKSPKNAKVGLYEGLTDADLK